MRVACYACATDVGRRERIGRRDTCARCGVDLHSCRQCRFYEPNAADACREPQAERVVDKERGNFCEHFACAETPRGAASRPGDARAQLEALFAGRRRP